MWAGSAAIEERKGGRGRGKGAGGSVICWKRTRIVLMTQRWEGLGMRAYQIRSY